MMMGFRCTALLCFTATAAAVTRIQPAPVFRVSLSRHRTKITAQLAGWTEHVNEAGSYFFCSEQTGECQWDPPQFAQEGYGDGAQQGYSSGNSDQQGYGGNAAQQGATQALWRLVPTTGVFTQYDVRNGEQQTLGRYDMIIDSAEREDESLYVSRQQCIVQVAADGSATLASIGRPSTLCRRRSNAPWFGLRRMRPLGDDIGYDGAHVLKDGEQISLDHRNPEGTIFTVMCQTAESAEDVGGGYDAHAQYQYSDDGNWVWNGAEWVPAR